jgi:hypothetical protein
VGGFGVVEDIVRALEQLVEVLPERQEEDSGREGRRRENRHG